MNLTRRETLALGAGAAAAVLLPGMALASAESDAAVEELTGGAAMRDGGIELTAPEIAENGNTVPVEVSAPGDVSITLLAAGNPLPGVATFHFGPLSGEQRASTRIRLAQTQDLIAIAKFEDGSVAKAERVVKVTIGGCGG